MQRSRSCHAAPDGATLALRAIGWILAEPGRAGRFLALTGLGPHDLRARIGDPALHGAIFGFLLAHEADLVACAAAIGEPPERIAAAGREAGA